MTSGALSFLFNCTTATELALQLPKFSELCHQLQNACIQHRFTGIFFGEHRQPSRK